MMTEFCTLLMTKLFCRA